MLLLVVMKIFLSNVSVAVFAIRFYFCINHVINVILFKMCRDVQINVFIDIKITNNERDINLYMS